MHTYVLHDFMRLAARDQDVPLLAVTTLVGLALNFLFGWWWTDPLAALVMVPLIFREALEGLGSHHE